MWQTLHDLSFGLRVAVMPLNLLAGALGVIAGTVIGVIPALGPTQGAALLLPMSCGSKSRPVSETVKAGLQVRKPMPLG